MTSMTERPSTGGRLLLSADAFLFAGALDLILTTLLVGVPLMFGVGPDIINRLGENAGSLISMGSSILLVFVGAWIAWRMHGRAMDGATLGAMVVGAIAGVFALLAVFVGGYGVLGFVFRTLGVGRNMRGPWLQVGVLAILVLAYVAVPLWDAVRDAATGRRQHVTLDWMRLVSFVVIVGLGVIALPMIGANVGGEVAEVGEAGPFAVPFAAAAAVAVLGADILSRRRHRGVDRVASAPM